MVVRASGPVIEIREVQEIRGVEETVEAMIETCREYGASPHVVVDLFKYMKPGHWRVYGERAGVIPRIPPRYTEEALRFPTDEFVEAVKAAYMDRVGYYGAGT